jgi:hypothetical protein
MVSSVIVVVANDVVVLVVIFVVGFYFVYCYSVILENAQ